MAEKTLVGFVKQVEQIVLAYCEAFCENFSDQLSKDFLGTKWEKQVICKIASYVFILLGFSSRWVWDIAFLGCSLACLWSERGGPCVFSGWPVFSLCLCGGEVERVTAICSA